MLFAFLALILIAGLSGVRLLRWIIAPHRRHGWHRFPGHHGHHHHGHHHDRHHHGRHHHGQHRH